MEGFLDVLVSRQDQLIQLFVQHVQLTIIAIVIAVVIGVPLGIFISGYRRLANFVIGVANLVQSVPSLALLGFLIPFVGIGSTPAIIMVVLYSMLPILKNTYAGIMNISPDMIEVAKGIGLTKRQTLSLIKLPLSVPIIMTGIRISAVTAVGLMTIAAFVGAGGLGFLVFSGMQSIDNNLILLGAIPAALLALLIDFIVGKIEEAVVPNGMKNAKGVIKRKNKKFSKTVKRNLLVLMGAVAIAFVGFSAYNSQVQRATIVVGSKNFTEQFIMGHLLATLIEENTDLNVERKINLNGTQVVFSAMETGGVDLYTEYSGTAFSSILDHEMTEDMDATNVYETAKKGLMDRYNFRAFVPLGFNNTFAMVVTQETADKYNLKTMSDLAAISNSLAFAPSIEFTEREDGMIGMNKLYNYKFQNVMPMDGSLRYSALINGDVDATSGYTTDGLIAKHDLVVLEDDKKFFLPYYAFILINDDILKEHPELEKVLEVLENNLSEEIMQELNSQVDVENKDPEVVARTFLKENNLID